MAQRDKKSRPVAKAAVSKADAPLPFGKTNLIVFIAGLVAIILGFITLASGSETLSPILLVLGYCVAIPVAILWKDKRQ